MELPRGEKKLHELFRTAEPAFAEELEGTYDVEMLTRWPSTRPLDHRKVIWREKDQWLGVNVLFSGLTWGHFKLEPGICDAYDPPLPVALINYGVEENSPLTRPIRDQVRRLEKGRLYLGRFNYLFGDGGLTFLGYFALVRRAQ